MSGSSSRRLSEVLSEQQEPFSLDLYLIEKGCSPAFLDAAACGGGACSTCWPRTSSGTGRKLRRPARSKKCSRGSRVLRLLLSKILSAGMTTTAPPPAATKKRQQQPATIDWRCVDERRRTPERSEPAALPCSCSSPRRAADVDSQSQLVEDDDGREQEEEEDDDEDAGSKKQMSPVSVLEHRLFEHSPPPPPPHAQTHAEALSIFSELLEAAYTPATSLLDFLAHAKDHRSGGTTKDGTAPTTTTPRARKKKDHHHHHARAHGREEEEEGPVSALVASEMLGGARVLGAAAELWPWARDVGADVAAAVLDALTEEAAAALLLMGMDQDCAADTARC